MAKNVVFVLVLVAIIVTVDVLFFRNRFRERLLANAGIVAVFIVVYFIFLKG